MFETKGWAKGLKVQAVVLNVILLTSLDRGWGLVVLTFAE